MIDAQVRGTGTWWPHLLNVLLHAGVTLLWYRLIRRLFGNETVALVAGALFAVHPIHTEAVTWLSGRAELLAAFFGLSAVYLAHSERPSIRWLTPLAILFAIGCKESAAVLPLVLLFSNWSLRLKRTTPSIKLGLISFAPVILYVVLRRFVLGTWAAPATDTLDNPMVAVGLFERIPTSLDCAGRYLSLLFWPARLSADYSAPVLGLVNRATPLFLFGLLATLGLIGLAVARREKPYGWAAGFALLTFALASNIPIAIGTIFAERLLYLPSAGLLLVVASGGVWLARQHRILKLALQMLLLIVMIAAGART